MNLKNLEKVFEDKPLFQSRQAKEAIFRNLIDDWSQATNLPQALRQRLNQECPLTIKAELFSSADKNSVKGLLILKDGLKAEAVLIRHQDGRNTVCVSSQIGCPLGCLFCATGKMGFKRNLEATEIVEQVLLFARRLKENKSTSCSPSLSKDRSLLRTQKNAAALPGQDKLQSKNNRINNIVFMGMGEPFLNYKNVLEAIKTINDKNGLNIGARHISISTVGITDGIEKLLNEPLQINLAISLHAPNNLLRSKIIPINKKYPIEKIFAAVKKYIQKTSRRVMIEYIMIKGVNDAPAQARELAALIKNNRLSPCFVNLISYNPTGIFKSSPSEKIKIFKKILENNKIAVTQRHHFGGQIKAACGQLAN